LKRLADFLEGKMLSLFVKLGTRWFGNVAFSCDPKSEQVRHIIFAQSEKWLESTIQAIEKMESKK
jgi:hypothetical protein